MIGCDYCEGWYHPQCVNLKEAVVHKWERFNLVERSVPEWPGCLQPPAYTANVSCNRTSWFTRVAPLRKGANDS
eukprot:3094406-Pyramimonas_sp.AAC.1